MKSSPSTIQHVSDTALWMASYRAKESLRTDALFHDPLADLLIGDHGKRVSASMRSIERYSYWTLVIRTRVIDDYISKFVKEGYRTIINLGAGLDTRPYRLALPSDLQWIEIDFLEVIELKNQKLKNEISQCRLQRIGVDLSNRDEREKVFSEINDRIGPAILLTEGVIPYLSEDVVRELALDLGKWSNFKLWIAEYYSPLIYPRFQSAGFQKLLGDSPFLFFPSDWFALFENSGWIKNEMHYLYDEGEKLGRKFPLEWWVKIIRLVIGAKKILEHTRVSAYVVYHKKSSAHSA